MTPCFVPVPGLNGVFTGQLRKLSCTLLRLADGGLCVYSPVAGLEKSLLAQQPDLGPVTAILAPNHYHNKGLKAHVEAFPNAALYASTAATPRLSQITGLEFRPMEGLQAALGAGQVFHEPHGLKTGEVWVQLNGSDARALIVTDAFAAAVRPQGEKNDRVTMLGTFPRYGVSDVAIYTAWASEMLTAAAPTILLPCHGAPVAAADLTSQLIEQVNGLRAP